MWMQTEHSSNNAEPKAVQTTRQVMEDLQFCQRHKKRPKDFTRRRELTFVRSLVFVLHKGVRATQQRLNDFFHSLDMALVTLTPSAWSQARLKFRHTAFIELNEVAILKTFYRELRSNYGEGTGWSALILRWCDCPITRI
jgi:hypothetical protein